MDEMPFTPPPPPPVTRKHSPLGIVSFVLSILSIGLICIFLIYAYIIGNSGTAITTQASVSVWVFICVISLFSLVGLGLGIAAVIQPASSKVFGVLGLVFNALVMIGFCILLILSVVVATSSMGYY